MGVRIRDAVPEDARSLVEIASSVKLRAPGDAGQQTRGFLIDISLDNYRFFIVNDHALAMEEDRHGRVVGFSVILGPRTMAASGMLEKAAHMEEGALSVHDLDPQTCAYWEQLAFFPRYAKGIYPVYLAFTSLRRAFLTYQHVFGAVACRPIPNMAPLRFLDFMGWRKAGWIDQDYPVLGRVRYDVYHLSRAEFERKLREPFFAHLEERLAARAVTTERPDSEKGGSE